METRITYDYGFSNFPNFEVLATREDKPNEQPKFARVFSTNIYCSKLEYPIKDKYYRLAGISGGLDDVFIETFGKDMLFLKNENEIQEALKQVIITMKYKVGLYNIVK